MIKTKTFTKMAIAVLCVFCSIVFAQKPKIAVYVSEHSGYSQDVKSALRTATLNVLVRSGQYEVVERSNVIDEELSRQASGDIDDDQLTAFGRQAGVQYICVSDMTSPFGEWYAERQVEKRTERDYYKDYQISVRIIDVETAEVVALAAVTKQNINGPLLSKAVSDAVTEMLKKVQDKKEPNIPKMAVYVQGGQANWEVGSALYTYVLEAVFTRSRYNGDFKVVERSEAFTRQISREQSKQHSGAVDDAQIRRMGKQYGIERILIANIDYAMNTYTISARIVNVETASIETASNLYHHEGNKMNDLREISIRMVEDMIRRKISAEEIEREKAELAAEQEVNRTASMMGVLIGGGVSLQMNEINPNLYKSMGGQFTASVEFYRRNTSFFRYGLSFDLGGLGINWDALRETYPNANTSSTSTYAVKPGIFLRLCPVNFLYLSGGAGWSWYGVNAQNSDTSKSIRIATVSTPIFPVGAGLILGPGGNGLLLEGQYNIVPFKGRGAKYLSFNAGFKFGMQLDKQEKKKRKII